MSAFVYRYVDEKDDIIKYIGIVYSKKRDVSDRIRDHFYKDEWAKEGSFRIDYFCVKTETEARAFEDHFITLYKTYNYYNKTPVRGLCSFLPDIEWIPYDNVTYDSGLALENNFDIMEIVQMLFENNRSPVKRRALFQKINIKHNDLNNAMKEYINSKVINYDLDSITVNGMYIDFCFVDGNVFSMTNGVPDSTNTYSYTKGKASIKTPKKILEINYIIEKLQYLLKVAEALGWSGDE